MNLDVPEKPSYPGQDDDKPCKKCELREQMEIEMGMDPSNQHVFAAVRKATHGSPTRFKGKRETLPVGHASSLEMTRPANQQHMAMT